jgi:hypothetical protein
MKAPDFLRVMDGAIQALMDTVQKLNARIHLFCHERLPNSPLTIIIQTPHNDVLAKFTVERPKREDQVGLLDDVA